METRRWRGSMLFRTMSDVANEVTRCDYNLTCYRFVSIARVALVRGGGDFQLGFREMAILPWIVTQCLVDRDSLRSCRELLSMVSIDGRHSVDANGNGFW